MSIELMFNAVNIALIAFSRYTIPQAMTLSKSALDEEIGLALTNGTPLGDTALNTLLTGQIFSIFMCAISEGLVLGMKSGLDPVEMVDYFKTSSHPRVFDLKGAALLIKENL